METAVTKSDNVLLIVGGFCLWRTLDLVFNFFLLFIATAFKDQSKILPWVNKPWQSTTGAFVYVRISGQQSKRQKWHPKPSSEKSSHTCCVMCFAGVLLLSSDKSLSTIHAAVFLCSVHCVNQTELSHGNLLWETSRSSCELIYTSWAADQQPAFSRPIVQFA